MKNSVLKISGILSLLALAGIGILFGLNDHPTLIDSLSNYPNPFDSRRQHTEIVYRLEESVPVRVEIYDLFGYRVQNFYFSPGQEGGRRGQNKISWDGRNASGNKVAKGGYICQVIVEGDQRARAVRKIGVIH